MHKLSRLGRETQPKAIGLDFLLQNHTIIKVSPNCVASRRGEMAEWFKAPLLKSGNPVYPGSRVRIPFSPPLIS